MTHFLNTYVFTREILTTLILLLAVFLPASAFSPVSTPGSSNKSIIPSIDLKEVYAFVTEPFGGYSYMVWYCTCQFAVLHYVGPPDPGAYLFQYGASYPYANYQVYRPGVWMLGKYSTGNYTCRFYVPPSSCSTLGAKGLITEVGTSF